jgi:hypothetical protein
MGSIYPSGGSNRTPARAMPTGMIPMLSVVARLCTLPCNCGGEAVCSRVMRCTFTRTPSTPAARNKATWKGAPGSSSMSTTVVDWLMVPPATSASRPLPRTGSMPAKAKPMSPPPP